MRALRAMALAVVACATPAPRPVGSPPPEPVVVAAPTSPDESRAVREVVERFLDAAEAGKFADALALLAEPVRSRYSVERIEVDFAADPSAKARVARVRAALAGEIGVRADVAVLPLEGGRRLRAVREPGGWRIAALEE